MNQFTVDRKSFAGELCYFPLFMFMKQSRTSVLGFVAAALIFVTLIWTNKYNRSFLGAFNCTSSDLIIISPTHRVYTLTSLRGVYISSVVPRLCTCDCVLAVLW